MLYNTLSSCKSSGLGSFPGTISFNISDKTFAFDSTVESSFSSFCFISGVRLSPLVCSSWETGADCILCAGIWWVGGGGATKDCERGSNLQKYA